jgi:hypothetical protein
VVEKQEHDEIMIHVRDHPKIRNVGEKEQLLENTTPE